MAEKDNLTHRQRERGERGEKKRREKKKEKEGGEGGGGELEVQVKAESAKIAEEKSTEKTEQEQPKWDKFDEKTAVYTFPGGGALEADIPELGQCFFAYREGRGKDKMDHSISFVYSIKPTHRDGWGDVWAQKRGEFNVDMVENGYFQVKWSILGEEGTGNGEGKDKLKKIFEQFKHHAEEKIAVEQKAEQERKAEQKRKKETPREEPKEQETGEQKRENGHLVREGEVEECLAYLWVRRELRNRWQKLEEKAAWLEEHPLNTWGLRPALVEQIIEDMRLEPIIGESYKNTEVPLFGSKEKPVFVKNATDDTIGNKVNKAEEKVVSGIVDDEEGVADLTEEERNAASQKWFKPPEKKKEEPKVERTEMERPLEKKDDKENREDRKNIERYRYLAKREDLDRPEEWTGAINRAMAALALESGGMVKEKGVENNGLIKLRDPELPTIIISDIHARRNSLLAILEEKADETGRTFFDYLKEGKINVVCLGDGMHSEDRGKKRWKKAFQEGFSVRERKGAGGADETIFTIKENNMEMNAEMVESLNTMRMIMDLKTAFSDNFHFLRGNHDDILGQDISGFKKYAEEGEMTRGWAEKNMGEEFVKNYARFEHSLPVVLTGKYFAASHSGPEEPFTASEIKQKDTEVLHGFTWTENYDIVNEEYGLDMMLDEFLPDCKPEERFWFIGHKPVNNNVVAERLGESVFVQLNNPTRLSFVVFDPKEREKEKMDSGFTKEEPTLDFVEDKKLFAKK